MKIIFFNVNDLTIDKDGATNYLSNHIQDTDIFCIQEAFENFEQLEFSLFKDFSVLSSYKFVTKEDYFRQVTLVKKNLFVKRANPVLEKFPKLGHGLYSQIVSDCGEFGLMNFHGVSRPVEKLDCEERTQQSRELINYSKTLSIPLIIGGDFNYLNDIESVKMFEADGFVNQINKFNITNTRNEVVWRKYPNNKMYYSDWIFTSPDFKVTKLTVPYNEFSDHLPLELSFELNH